MVVWKKSRLYQVPLELKQIYTYADDNGHVEGGNPRRAWYNMWFINI
jgi:hypothetical protein